MRTCRGGWILNTLGMARRVGELYVGQDKVLAALKGGRRFAVFLADDCAANVLRRVKAAEARGTAELFLIKETGRSELGASLGVASAQIAALSADSRFMKKIYTLTCDRSDANE